MKKLLYRVYPALINVYTVFMLYLLFFATFRDDLADFLTIEYVPFKTIIRYLTTVLPYRPFEFTFNMIGNIVMFIPYGFLGILYPKLNRLGWLLLAFIVVINIIEFSQFYFKRGFADVDDVILNTLGVVIGFLIYKKCFFIKGK
ncbi:VanZ family protein [Epilithonimonas hungarica]|uniref:VanZ like family protein n=1 Tax=Epilithonimonas hungarica TaxID=454006 RepID=A0A1G7NGW9_9FLAO|nr:VanZ family protein [Epilithonimonas hungarica]SDF73345.1 VanZ like family protein [Epilithonimonas hungarica]